MPKFLSVDTISNVAFSECGGVFSVEDYLDEYENPCLSEEAYYVSIQIGSCTFKTVKVRKD